MKKQILNLCALFATGGLLLAGATSHVQAQQITNTYLQTFDAGGNTTPFAGTGSVAGWFYWYNYFGNAGVTNDPTMDAGGDPTSGSLEVSLPFGSAGNGEVIFGSFDNKYEYDTSQTANALNFTNITFQIHVQPGTQPDNSGNFGSIGVGLLENFSGGGTPSITKYITIPGAASNGWVTITAPIDKTAVGINNVGGFFFGYSNYSGYPTNPITFWLDNVSLNLGGAPPPPPTLSVEKPLVGFNVIDGSSGVNDRESIMSTTTTGNTWVGRGSPVTYSFTVSSYPDSATYPGFASYMFLIPGPYSGGGNQAAPYSLIPSYETAPDYNETNVVFFDLENQSYNVTNGATVTAVQGAVAQFRYKANEPNGNSMIYGNAPYTNAPGSGSANTGSGTLGSVHSPSALGTWSITFNNDTSITMTAPGGNTSTFTMASADAALFSDAGNFTFLLGSQANSSAALGQRVVYSNVSITGTATPLSDNFATDSVLDTNKWTLLASAPSGLLVVPSTTAYWIDWTLPDIGFSLQDSTTLSGGAFAWNDVSIPAVGQIAGTRRTLIPQSSLLAGNTGFYRLVQRSFSGLQVLFPGETNAPGTVSGKVGTPTPIDGDTAVTVTINAVDSTWHIIGGISDTVSFSSDDGTAFLPSPTPLVNGTLQEILFFDTDGSSPGTHHLTVTDQTNGAITPNTSSGFSVN